MERLVKFDPLSAPQELSFALRWYYKGMVSFPESKSNPTDAFISIWIALITVVRAWHATNVGGDPPETTRFREYLSKRLGLSATPLEDRVRVFHDTVVQRRNELVKGGGFMNVSQPEIQELMSLAHQALSFELDSHLEPTA